MPIDGDGDGRVYCLLLLASHPNRMMIFVVVEKIFNWHSCMSFYLSISCQIGSYSFPIAFLCIGESSRILRCFLSSIVVNNVIYMYVIKSSIHIIFFSSLLPHLKMHFKFEDILTTVLNTSLATESGEKEKKNFRTDWKWSVCSIRRLCLCVTIIRCVTKPRCAHRRISCILIRPRYDNYEYYMGIWAYMSRIRSG